MRRRTAIIISAAVAALGVWRVALPVLSAPLSTGATQRLTVYGGAITITPGRHCSIDVGTSCTADSSCPVNEWCVGTLELGASGVDITSDTDIVIRPGTVPGRHCSIDVGTSCTIDTDCPTGQTCTVSTATHPTRFSGRNVVNNIQDLTVSGNVSLMTDGKAMCLQGTCRTAWNRNLENWVERNVNMETWTLKFIEPTDLTRGVSIGTAAASFTAGTAVTAEGLFAANHNTAGKAATFTGNIWNIQDLTVWNTMTANSVAIYSEQNDGNSSKLDATKLDGVIATLRHGYACDATVCVCFNGTPTHHGNIDIAQTRCIPLYAGVNVRDGIPPTTNPPY